VYFTSFVPVWMMGSGNIYLLDTQFADVLVVSKFLEVLPLVVCAPPLHFDAQVSASIFGVFY